MTDVTKCPPILVTGRPPREVCRDIIDYVMPPAGITLSRSLDYAEELKQVRDEALDPFMADLIEVVDCALPAEFVFTAVRRYNGDHLLMVVPTEAQPKENLMEKTPFIVVGVTFSGSPKVYHYRLAKPLIPHGLTEEDLPGMRAVTAKSTSYSVPTIVGAVPEPGLTDDVVAELDWIVQVVDRRPYELLCAEYRL